MGVNRRELLQEEITPVAVGAYNVAYNGAWVEKLTSREVVLKSEGARSLLKKLKVKKKI